MVMNSKLFAVFFTVLILLGCVKNNIPQVDPIDMNFDWKSTKNITISIPQVQTKLGAEKSIIYIYTAPSLADGSLISSGIASASEPFKTNIDLPKDVNKIYVKMQLPNGLISVKSYSVGEDKATQIKSTINTKANNDVVVPDIVIPDKFDVTFGSSHKFTGPFLDNRTYYIPKDVSLSTKVNIFNNYQTVNLPTLYVSGTLSIDNIRNMSYSRLVILDGGKVTFKGQLLYIDNYQQNNNLAIYVEKGGELNFDKGFKMGSNIIVNKGVIKASNGTFEFYGNPKVYNLGEMKSDEFTSGTKSLQFYQLGTLTIKDECKFQGTLYNYGKTEIDELLDDSFTFYGKEGSLLKIGEMNNTNSVFNCEAGSIVYINEVGSRLWGAKFINTSNSDDDFALVIWGEDDDDDEINLDGKGCSFTGSIENYCPSNSTSLNLSHTQKFCTNNAFWTNDRVNYIPESEFNEGFGTDGNKPVDPAPEWLESYFPSKDSWATFIFEDLWPYTGDYDMNDLVLCARLKYLSLSTDNSNLVRYMDIEWMIKAVGSGMSISAGVQLVNINSSAVSSVITNNTNLGGFPINNNNNGLESGQSKAVFPLFNSPAEVYNGQELVINTNKDLDYFTPQVYATRVSFLQPISKDNLSLDLVDFFIVPISTNIKDRGREIHMQGYKGTDKLNKAYVAEGFISPNDYFKASNGMVWACMIPVEFKYPLEKVPITTAYPDFIGWYSSSGINNKDWYLYGNESKLY